MTVPSMLQAPSFHPTQRGLHFTFTFAVYSRQSYISRTAERHPPFSTQIFKQNGREHHPFIPFEVFRHFSIQTVGINASKVFNVECWVQHGILLLNFFPALLRFLTTLPMELIKQEAGEIWGYRHERLEGLECSDERATIALENNVYEESGSSDESSQSRRHTETSPLWTESPSLGVFFKCFSRGRSILQSSTREPGCDLIRSVLALMLHSSADGRPLRYFDSFLMYVYTGHSLV
jgi:hypothetical protein